MKYIMMILMMHSYAIAEIIVGDEQFNSGGFGMSGGFEMSGGDSNSLGNNFSDSSRKIGGNSFGRLPRTNVKNSFGAVSPNCPFQEPSRDTKQILNRVEDALRNLEAESRNCPQADQAIRASQASLAALQRNESLQVFSNNPSQTNCTNYEAKLRREFDVARSNSEGSSFDFNISSTYQKCSGQADASSCLEKVYVNQLATASANCTNLVTAEKNQIIRDNLESLTNTTMGLISNSSSCGPKAQEAIFQTVIAQASAAASLAQGFGLVGLGINIAGRLLSAIAGNFFNKNSASSFLEKISAEKSRPSRFCLYYDIQKAALRCEDSIYKNQTTVQTSNPICETQNDAISNLRELSSQIRGPLLAMPTKNESEKKQALLDQSQSFIQALEQPVGTDGKKYIDILSDASDTLSKSDSPTDLTQARELKEAVDLYKQMKSNKTADPNKLVSQLTELSSLLMGYPVAETDTRSLNLPKALSRYVAIKNAGGLASTVNATQSLLTALEYGNKEATEAAVGIKKINDQNSIDLALSALVSTLKPEFEQRLVALNKDYSEYKDKEKNAERHLQWLGEMLSICMSSQGISYFPAHANQSRLNMSAQPGKTFQQICEQFNCPGEKIYLPFNEKDSRYGNGSRIEKFENYQCALDRKTKSAIDSLANNLKVSGKICAEK